jgi:hypothetical protein
MTWFMIARNKNGLDELPFARCCYMVIAMVLAPLLLVKVLIARYYKSSTAAGGRIRSCKLDGKFQTHSLPALNSWMRRGSEWGHDQIGSGRWRA